MPCPNSSSALCVNKWLFHTVLGIIIYTASTCHDLPRFPEVAQPANPQRQTQLRCHALLGGLLCPVVMLTSRAMTSLLIHLILLVQAAA